MWPLCIFFASQHFQVYVHYFCCEKGFWIFFLQLLLIHINNDFREFLYTLLFSEGEGRVDIELQYSEHPPR